MAKKNNVKNTEKAKNDNKTKRHFWKDFKAELKKVVWPTKKQLLNSTVAVITIVLITALIVFVLDIGFEAINKHGINRLQTVLQKDQNTVEENTTSEMNTDEASSEDSTVENTTDNEQ